MDFVGGSVDGSIRVDKALDLLLIFALIAAKVVRLEIGDGEVVVLIGKN